ncbi:hypothetical protein BGX34_007566 [Mortierella sp. NVP85]|nr:hypothetical protein BGX34_007566 [Mortierella sp. NVP85]
MPHEPLPLECFLEILRILSKEYDTDTMARLLCVSKTFCAVTLPFLYRDCFNNCMHRNQLRSKKTPAHSMHQLIRTLLRQVHPQSRIPGLAQAVYLSQDHPQLATESPIFNYAHFVRKLMTFQKIFLPKYDRCRKAEKSRVEVLGRSAMDYAAAQQPYEKYFPRRPPSNAYEEQVNDILERTIEENLNQQLVWTLCQDHAGSIQELTISLPDIERYIDHAHHFKSLSQVDFTAPNALWSLESLMASITSGEALQSDRNRVEWCFRLIRAMVRFVQQHISIHKNVLKSVIMPSHLCTFGQLSTADAQLEIFSLLPPLHNPRSIDTFNWRQIVARHSEINLDHVESIVFVDNIHVFSRPRIGPEPWALNILKGHPPFLQRCRALKRLAMETLGPDMFHWAVLEKKKRAEGHQQEGNVGRHLSSREHGYHHDLVPLRSIKLVNRLSLPFVQELNDIAFAFSDTLEELVAASVCGPVESTLLELAAIPPVIYGQDWDLPRLRELSLKVGRPQLHFEMDALNRSRTLEALHLRDGITTYSHQDIGSWSSVHLPHLKKLELMGSPAVRFNLESLHHSPCLEELTLGTLGFNYVSLVHEDPDNDELSGMPGTVSQGYPSIRKRSRWTWDWDLPSLCKLCLEAAFAYKFDFQWLQQLPNIQHIALDMATLSGHRRRITLKDLSRRGLQQQDEDGHAVLDRYIRLPKLESIFLSSYWTYDQVVMETLCLVVSPNLRSVYLLSSCSSPTLQEWITLSRKMSQLKTLYLNTGLTRREIQELGLVSKDLIGEEERNKKRIEYILRGKSYYDCDGITDSPIHP